MPKNRKKPGTRKLKRRFIIFCEGSADKSESAYFKGLIKDQPRVGNNVEVKVIDTKENTGRELVKRAKKEKLLDDDEMWVVYDRDGYTKHPEAFDEANANGINIAFSSVCFEYWILLHFESTTAGDHKCEQLYKKVRKYEKRYNKKTPCVFELLRDRLPEAIKNAKKARAIVLPTYPNRTPRYKVNPYTDVDILVEGIEKFVKKYR